VGRPRGPGLSDSFDPDEVLDLVEREGATQIDGFDTHLKLLIDAQEARRRSCIARARCWRRCVI